MLTGVFGYGILYFDGILIAALMPIKEFSIYRNGAIEIPFLSTIYVSVSSVILPEMSRLANENKMDELLALKRKASLNVATLIFRVVFYFIMNGEFLIKTYLSEKYIESAIVFSLYNITTLARITDYHDVFTITGNANKLLLYYLGGCN